MQGWRLNMEDAHITNPTFDTDIGLFAVFDGHGGLECAKFCERYFEPKLKEQPEYQNRTDFQKAFENTFLGLDKMLMTPQGIEALVQISKENPN
jgi:protein phosphatase 1G